nr:uncharacterized protein LOC109174816 [Ipomoea batatas]
MRSVLFISLLLLLSTLFNEAQGRHLRKGGDLPARNHKTNENGSIRRSDQGSKGENKIDECKDEAMKTKVSRATKLEIGNSLPKQPLLNSSTTTSKVGLP